MSKLPIIGVSANINSGKLEINDQYFNALTVSGAIPFLLPYTDDESITEAACSLCDGFLLSGGVDIDPAYYGEERLHECGETIPARDKGEMALLKHILASGKPIMAICRGAQILNVALGGTLWQDISTQYETAITHRMPPGTEVAHNVNVIKGTPLYDIIGYERFDINTIHHQAVKTLGAGLVASAVADDGIIEAYYHEGERYIRAYQWHPERIYPISKESAPIFADFINACK